MLEPTLPYVSPAWEDGLSHMAPKRLQVSYFSGELSPGATTPGSVEATTTTRPSSSVARVSGGYNPRLR